MGWSEVKFWSSSNMVATVFSAEELLGLQMLLVHSCILFFFRFWKHWLLLRSYPRPFFYLFIFCLNFRFRDWVQCAVEPKTFAIALKALKLVAVEEQLIWSMNPRSTNTNLVEKCEIDATSWGNGLACTTTSAAHYYKTPSEQHLHSRINKNLDTFAIFECVP